MTSLIAVVVAVVPGGLLGFVLPPGRYRWAVWASAPGLTLGLTAAAMAWLPAVGLPHSAFAVLVAELVLAGAAILVSRLIARGLPIPAEDGERKSLASRFRLRPVRPQRADVIGLLIPIVITVGYGWVLLGRLIAPPGWDAMNHGMFTRQILDKASATISTACVSGSTEPVVSCTFYPLAANVSWAQAAQLSGGQIGDVMTAWSILVGPIALITGIYACVRVLGGGPVVAACAATAPAFLGPMWLSVVTGRITQQTGPAMVAGIALLTVLALRGRHPVRLGLLAGLSGAGLIMTHTYDVLVVAVLALGLLLWLQGRLTLRDASAAVGAAVIAGLLALGPFLKLLLEAKGEREANPPPLLGKVGEAFDYWVTDPQRYILLGYPAPGGKSFQLDVLPIQIGLAITVPCLLASLFCLVLPRLRWARPWLLTGVVFTAVGLWTASSDSAPAMLLSSLWYGVRERLRSMIFPVYGVLAVAGAVAIGTTVHWLITKVSERAQSLRGSSAPPAIAASILVLVLALLAALPPTWHPIRGEFKRRAPVGESYVEAYEWLAKNTPPGKVVAYDRHREFMTWSYIHHGVPLLFGLPPLPSLDTDDYDRRWEAWNWLVNNEGASPAGCDVRRFGVEYVVVGGGRHMPGGWEKHYDQERLDASDRVRLVRQFSKIKIYQVTDAGRACADPADNQ